MLDFIYLASGSQSRQELLKMANIPFIVIKQNANEDQFDRNDSLQNVVTQIAQEKMRCAILPSGTANGQTCYVLTCDTMGINGSGQIFGKPIDKAEAIYMLESYREGAETGTAFCLDKKTWDGSHWQIVASVTCYVNATYKFNVPNQMLDLYFKHTMAKFGASYLDVSGAVAIEDYGMQFVTDRKSVV